MTGDRELVGPDHPILVDNGLLTRAGELVARWAPAHRHAIITDSHVGALYAGRVQDALSASGLTADVLTFPAGERHKTRDTWATLTDELLTTGFGRDSTIIALGGGVVTDLAGFVAATYMRGIPVVHVPTTLAGMVDAAIGGKTGVDTPVGKNLVGSFHPAAGILIDPEVLVTLPLREFQAGMAEVLKHGAIADAAYFHEVASGLPGLLSVAETGGQELRRIVFRSVEIKVEVVRADPREAGIRKILNFGHTLGHAIEAASDYALLHGEAIAIGMVAETVAAEAAGVTEAGTSEALRRALVSAGLPVAVPTGLTPERVLDIAAADKKKRGGILEFAVPHRIGEAAAAGAGWVVRLPEGLIMEALR